MSAVLLRRAARLMRARAEVATPGPWTRPAPAGYGEIIAPPAPGHPEIPGYGGHVIGESASLVNALHIVSWPPEVAVAVAEWLDDEAALTDDPKNHAEPSPAALTVARAYLGEPS